MELVGSTGLTCSYYYQSGTIDHHTGKFYWLGYAGNGFLAEVNMETGRATVLCTGIGQQTSFCIPFNGSLFVHGAMVYRDNELIGFTSDNSFLDEGDMNNHQYDIRVVYSGAAICPDNNMYYSMSCPQTVFMGEIFEITATANPSEGGAVTGAGYYGEGQLCTLTATANEDYTFVNWTRDGEEVSTSMSFSFTVTEDASYVANFSLDQSEVTQVSNFSQGYNWWCSYIEQNGVNGLQMLEEGLGGNGVTIRSQVGYTDYYAGYGWYGSLSSMNNESSYKVITSAPCTVTMTGAAAVPSQHPITVSYGWTWIGYVPSTAMSVDVAMAGMESTQGDRLKSQQGYSDYYPGYGWFGSLNTIEPGMGLMYYSTNSNPVTFTYPDGNKGGAQKRNLTAENNHWEPNPYAYPTNMTILAVIDLDGEEIQSEDYELAVFDANGECRGSIMTMYVDVTGRYYAFLTIYGDAPVELHFGLYDWQIHGECFDVDETWMYDADAMFGSIFDPVVLHFHSLTNMDEFDGKVKVYPNPVNCGEQFNLGLTDDVTNLVRVEIVNALGMIVETVCTPSHQTLTAPNVAGVYTLRITTEDERTCIRKLVVK